MSHYLTFKKIFVISKPCPKISHYRHVVLQRSLKSTACGCNYLHVTMIWKLFNT